MPYRRIAAEEMIAAIQEEAEWRRVKHFIVFLHTGQRYCRFMTYSRIYYYRL